MGIDADKNTVKFALISSARSGSNMLQTLLDSHPSIRCYGELFNPTHPLGFRKWTGRSMHNKLLSRFNHQYCVHKYLDDMVAPRDAQVTAVGFKVMYPGQFNRCGIFPRYWQENGFKLVRLIRENLLRRYVSGRIASRDERWSAKQTNSSTNAIRVDLGLLMKSLRRMQIVNSNIEGVVAEFENIIINYNELVERPLDTVREIFSFFDLPAGEGETVAPRTARQNPFPFTELIENYDEVASALLGTEYEWMLEQEETSPARLEEHDVAVGATSKNESL